MAKVTGPLMSLSASGKLANTLVFSIWKGRPYVRQLVTPSNPRTSGQVIARNSVAAIAKAAHAVLTSFADIADVGSPFFTAARDMAPSGQSWISFLQKVEGARYSTAIAAFAALSGTIKGYFETTAAAIGLVDYAGAPGGGDAVTNGAQLYLLADFASNELTGTVKTDADTAIAAAAQGDVDTFGDDVHLTT